jgi:hypothetical protein
MHGTFEVQHNAAIRRATQAGEREGRAQTLAAEVLEAGPVVVVYVGACFEGETIEEG